MKPKHRKILFAFISLAGIFLCLLIIILVVTPRLINLEMVKEEMRSRLEADIGAEIEYRRLDLAFFPRPHLVMSRVNFALPDRIKGTVDSLKVYPKILPLFSGDVQIRTIHSRSPEITIRLPETSNAEDASPRPLTFESLGDSLDSVLASISEFKIPVMVAAVSNGRVDFLKGPERILGLQSVNGQISSEGDLVEFTVRCHSNFWENITVEGQYEQSGSKVRIQIAINRFRPHAVADYLFPRSDLKMTNARADLSLDLKTDGPKHLQADISGSIPYMYWRRGNKELKITGTRFAGGFQLEDRTVRLSLTQLDLQEPDLSLAGRLEVNPQTPRIRLEVESKQTNVATAQKIATALTENSETVSEIFEILRGGDIQQINVRARAPDWAQMADEKNYVIRGSLLNGKISIPEVSLDLENVRGDATIENGILKGENAEARMGNSSAKQGKISIALTEATAPFHVEALIQADLAQLPPVLANLVEDDQFKKELMLVSKVEGTAVGKMIIGEDTRDVNVRVMASDIRLNADYQRIPYPVVINAGNLRLDGSRMALTDIDASIGKSSFSRLSSSFGWEKSSSLELSSKSATVDLDQLHAWLAQNKTIERELENLSAVSGTLSLQNASLSGPLFQPLRWRLQAGGAIRNLSLSSPLLPGELTVEQGPVDFEGDRFKMTSGSVNVGKSSFADLSAELQWSKTATLTVNSGMTLVLLDEVYPWLQSHERLKQHVEHLQPLNGNLAFRRLLFESTLNPENGNKLNLSAAIERWHVHSLKLPTDIELTGGHLIWSASRIDLLQTGARFGASTVNRLSLGGQWGKNASIELNADSADIRIADLYPWLISFERLDRMFKGYAASGGKLTLSGLGFKAPLGRSGDWQFQIAGEAAGLALKSDHFKAPIQINSAKFSAADTPGAAAASGRIQLDAARLSWENSLMTLQGNASFSTGELLLDLKLFADRLTWEQVKQITDVEKNAGTGDPLLLLGSLKVESDHFAYDEYGFQPMHADISFGRTDTRVVIQKADLCGIRLPGYLKISADALEFSFNPLAENQALGPSITCFFAQQKLADGSFDLEGELMSKAKPGDFLRSLNGNLQFKAEQGRIYRFGMLAKIFALLNVTEIYRGEVPDLKGKGFAYNSVMINGVFEDGKLIISESSIDSPSMGIAIKGDIDLIKKKVNLVVLIAPFKTVDRIVKLIPLVGNIMGGKLISIPFRAIGDLGDPDVIPLSPTAVGSGLLGILERTIKLPITIIQPVLPRSKSDELKEKEEKDY